MSEYIDRAALKQELAPYEENDFSQQMDVILAIVDAQPTADVVEVRHGIWEKFSTASGIVSRVRCSVCAGTQPLTFESMPYCPNCGARMDKEDEHEAG
jgi:hypothetical protein